MNHDGWASEFPCVNSCICLWRRSTSNLSPKSSFRPRLSEYRTAAYCVRLCDGRHFPAPSVAKTNTTEGCKSLCPASEVQVFHGSTIDGAHSLKGQGYSALTKAFRYRKQLVERCTCNGKDVVGLASLRLEDDATLRLGDMLATADGMKVVRRIVDGEPQLAATSNPMTFR
jgi:hypothetical protein